MKYDKQLNEELLKKIRVTTFDKKTILETLDHYGVCVLSKYISEKTCTMISSECKLKALVKKDMDFSDGSYRRFDGPNVHPESKGQDKRVYHPDCFSKLALNFKQDKFIADICSEYMDNGEKPYSVHVQIFDINDTPNDLVRGPHIDSFQTSTFKAFLYLDHVGENNGPTSYILGSHKDVSLREKKKNSGPSKKYLENEENRAVHPTNFSLEELGEERIKQWVRILGDQGDVVLFDTYGVHCGTNTRLNGVREVLVNYYRPGENLPRSKFGYDYKQDQIKSGNFLIK